MSNKKTAGRRGSASISAAGGVVWRWHDGGLQVAVAHRPRYDDWSLPKGKLEPGESQLAAAVREVGEEIGSHVAVSRRLPGATYPVGDATKHVAFWTMRHLSGEFVANDEVDDMRWLAPEQADALLSYPVERHVLADFAAVPVPDSVVVLVRHAKAGKRSQWRGEDALRPLDGSGRAQARRLRDFLAAFAPDRIVSAQPLRCIQTVQPLADQLELQIGVEPAFDDNSFETAPDSSEAALLGLAKPRRVTVVASQGGTIPGLVERLMPDVGATDTRKGAAWVLSVVDSTVVAADYYNDAAR